MQRLCLWTALLGGLAVTATARARSKPADASAPPPHGATSTQSHSRHPKKKTQSEPTETPKDATEQPKTLPPPGPPHATDQKPAPYLKKPPPERPVRKVDVGPDFGVWQRSSNGSDAHYGAGFAWGAHARINIASWFALRTSFVHEDVPVTVRTGALGLPGADIHQPDLTVALLGLRLEPTWVIKPRLRAWFGAGLAWGRITAPPLTTSGAFGPLHTTERSGVLLEYSAALGFTVDVIRDWLAASLTGSAGVLTNQSGSIFDGQQDRDQQGHFVQAGGLPKFGASYSGLLSVSLLL